MSCVEFSVNSVSLLRRADSGAVLLGLNVVAELPLPQQQQQQDPAQVLTLINVLNTVTIFFSFLTTYPVNLILIRSLSSISWYLELITVLKTWIPWDFSHMI